MCEDEKGLYCRNDVASGDKDVGSAHYMILEPTNGALWDWVQGNMDALSACPYKTLIDVQPVRDRYPLAESPQMQ